MAAGVLENLISQRRLRRARLLSGLIIFTFLTMHMMNHMFGLISVEMADYARRWFLPLWRNPAGTVLLYGAFLTHITLVLGSLYMRRSMAMPWTEAAQIILGLLVPILLIDHIVSTRLASTLFYLRDNYEIVVHSLWTKAPFNGAKQALALLVIWLHGCLGIHFWLRYRPWYTAIWPGVLTVAILMPTLSLLGFMQMGRTMSTPVYLMSGFPGGYYDPSALPAQASQQLHEIRLALHGTFATLVIFVFAARGVRWLRERAHLITIRFPEGQAISVPRGYTVLEASRMASRPHYAVCGGKGRCSTCRVQIIEGSENLSPPDSQEERTLSRIKAGPGVRLACQLRPNGPVTLTPLLVAKSEVDEAPDSYEAIPGREREIAVLFCDIRNFTTLTETRLPFDIVFLLNRYFSVVGHAVEQAGGRMDKFIGDGAMALFGLSGNAELACRQALDASRRIIAGIEALNEQLANELPDPLRIAMGIHTGPAVVGTLGYGNARTLTAIGDTVNVASRLETVAKDLDTKLVLSEPVARLAGLDLSSVPSQDIAIRGRTESLKVFVFEKGVRKALEGLVIDPSAS
ncbi:adenylate/guanylate cyclase domain-containing protein [Rhizobium helianthi]|uniref:Adenylate/guanylate cyclase domain-containing protein n=1 Tax=Rhizobium helianthi TaxID=1132695 RepID=A0ABW4M1E9_9HYPH